MSFIISLTAITSLCVAIASSILKVEFKYYSWIKYYCILNATIEISSIIFANIGINNIPLYYVLVWVEFFFLIQFYHLVSDSLSKVSKRVIFTTIYMVLTIMLLFFDSLKQFTPFSGIFEGITIFLFSLLVFRDEIRNPRYSDILKAPIFWFVAGFLIYYGCSWIILLGTQLFTIEPDLFIYIWDGQNILNILKNILIGVGLLCLR